MPKKGKHWASFLPEGVNPEGPGKRGAVTMTLDNMPEFLTVPEAAGLLRVRVQTIRRWMSEGWIAYHRLQVRNPEAKSGAVRIHRSVMLDLLQRGFVPEQQ